MNFVQDREGDVEKAPLAEASEADRDHSVPSPPTAVDLVLVIYGLTTGVLAVSAGTLLADANQHWGAPRAISWLVVAAITVVAGLFADSLLSWLLPLHQRSDSLRDS
jgi:hypothetical protein